MSPLFFLQIHHYEARSDFIDVLANGNHSWLPGCVFSAWHAVARAIDCDPDVGSAGWRRVIEEVAVCV